jgi:hypothetical protein
MKVPDNCESDFNLDEEMEDSEPELEDSDLVEMEDANNRARTVTIGLRLMPDWPDVGT